MAKYKFNKKNIKKIVGICLILISTICFIPLFTGLIGFLKHFVLGIFGLFAYPLFILLFVVGIALLNKKKYIMPIKYIVFVTAATISLLAIIQMAIMHNYEGGFFSFLGNCYTRQLTPGGIFVGVFIAPIKYLLNNIGVYVIFSITFITFTWLMIDFLIYVKKNAENGKIVGSEKVNKTDKKSNLENKTLFKIKEQKGDWVVDSDGNLLGREGEEIELKPELDKKSKKEKQKIVLDAKIDEENTNTNAKKKLGLIKNGVIETSENIKTIQAENPLQKKLINKEISKKDYILTPPNFLDVVNYTNNMKQVVNSSPNAEVYMEDINKTFSEMKKSEPEKIFHDETSDFNLFKSRISENKGNTFENNNRIKEKGEKVL